ncbi:MAG: helix-turn-helix domain-containing protein [Chloroflexota bacterium]|nr:helix-turn-helix domain-containing protein [Chloroflexota bacterium]
MDEILKTLGMRIRALRQHTGLSQGKMAVKAGLDRTYYAGIERGERNPSVKQLAKIAAALDVPIGMLFDVSERDQRNRDISPNWADTAYA